MVVSLFLLMLKMYQHYLVIDIDDLLTMQIPTSPAGGAINAARTAMVQHCCFMVFKGISLLS